MKKERVEEKSYKTWAPDELIFANDLGVYSVDAESKNEFSTLKVLLQGKNGWIEIADPNGNCEILKKLPKNWHRIGRYMEQDMDFHGNSDYNSSNPYADYNKYNPYFNTLLDELWSFRREISYMAIQECCRTISQACLSILTQSEFKNDKIAVHPNRPRIKETSKEYTCTVECCTRGAFRRNMETVKKNDKEERNEIIAKYPFAQKIDLVKNPKGRYTYFEILLYTKILQEKHKIFCQDLLDRRNREYNYLQILRKKRKDRDELIQKRKKSKEGYEF